MTEVPQLKRPSAGLVAAWVVVATALCAVLYAASSALAPFLIAVVLAYIGVPLVDMLSAKRMNRTAATCLVVLLLMAIVLFIPIALLPIVIAQSIEVIKGLPNAFSAGMDWLTTNVPYLSELDIKKEGLSLWESGLALNGAALEKVAGFLGAFGKNLGLVLGFFATLLIAPLVAFYLMRDWHGLVKSAEKNIPAAMAPTVSHIASITDKTLSNFLRGQLSVMLAMAVIYSILLSIAGAPFAVAIGVVTGLLCFIPYVGFALGLFLVVVVTLLNFNGLGSVAWPVAAMLVGNVLESFWLTPKLVGERSGLGPVAVLLALSVMGSLFGFAGMLVAIPLAAVIFAVWKHYLPSFTGRDASDAV